MSTDRSRLVSSIRRIVLTDPDLSSALDAWQNRGDQASSTGTGTSDAERDRLCCDGSTSDNPNPGADTRDTSDGGQDGLNADDPALLDSGPGSLTGVTDCATGEPICFDGNDWLPPEGWGSPTDPPVEDDYDSSVYYEVVINGDQTFTNSCGKASDIFNEAYDYYCGLTRDVCSETGTGELWGFACTNDEDEFGEGQVFRRSCSATPNDVCDDPPPLEDSWPEDGCTNLAIKNGTIVGSKYDPENDGTYSKPMSEIELCDEFGNQIKIRPAGTGVLPTGEQTSVPEKITGGWKTFNTTTDNGYLYDSQGNKIAHIDGNEYADPDV